MGLDIAFNKEKALKAGLEILSQSNGTPEEILEASTQDTMDTNQDYLDWLR